ncbi:MAG: hypothetical protein CSA21_07830, partial [Deltaproteobacteria bacterium]
SPRLPDAYFNFLTSGLVAYLTHQAVQSIGSTAIRGQSNNTFRRSSSGLSGTTTVSMGVGFFFWGGRFKRVIVDAGETLINFLAYVGLNTVRAGIIDKPENYRWSSLGDHSQTTGMDKGSQAAWFCF